MVRWSTRSGARNHCRLQLNRRLFARHSHAPDDPRPRLIAPYPLVCFRCRFQLIRGLFAAYSWRGQSSGTASALHLVDENPFIVSLLARPAQPAGRASAWRAESTPRGAPQGVRETRWQTDTNPSDPRSEDSEAKKLQGSLTQQALGHGSDHLQPTGPVLQTGDGCCHTVAQPVFVPPVLAP